MDEALPQVAHVRSSLGGPVVSAGPPLTDVGYLLNKATRHLRLRLAEALADTGLTPQQAAVLLAIGRSVDGRLTPRTIAESVDTDQATTSGLLERLTRDGWLRSEPHPDDGRSRLVGLSEKAERALPAVLGAADHVSREATAALSVDEVRKLRELLGRLYSDVAGETPARREGS